MTQDELKKAAAHAALDHVVEGSIVGVGTGSTVNHFIDALAGMRDRIRGAVSSSEASTQRLRAHGIEVFDLDLAGTLRDLHQHAIAFAIGHGALDFAIQSRHRALLAWRTASRQPRN